jgi:hypothetical protein
MSDAQQAAFAKKPSPVQVQAWMKAIETGAKRKPAPLLLTEAQAADRLGCSVKTQPHRSW